MNNHRRKKKGRFIGIPYSIVTSNEFLTLRSPEVKLLVDLLVQYNGSNNGSLSPCHALLKNRGWASSSLYRAYTSLLSKGFLVITRQGMKIRGMATMVAITWNGIDESKGFAYDSHISPSPVPLNSWRNNK